MARFLFPLFLQGLVTHVIAPKLTETLWKREVRNRVLLLEDESSVKRGTTLDKKLLSPLSRAW